MKKKIIIATGYSWLGISNPFLNAIEFLLAEGCYITLIAFSNVDARFPIKKEIIEKINGYQLNHNIMSIDTQKNISEIIELEINKDPVIENSINEHEGFYKKILRKHMKCYQSTVHFR